MVELIENEDGELVGVTARNVWYIKFYGITREEYDETCNVIKQLFGGEGYKYIAEANKLFKEIIDKQKNDELTAENSRLKEELLKKEARSVPKTLGIKG
jgi:hypothetical protein